MTTSLTDFPSAEYGFFTSLKKSFEQNDIALLHCADGYTSTVSTSRVILNSKNQLVWDPPVLKCGLSELPFIKNGRCVSNSLTPYYEGTEAEIQCDPGYVLNRKSMTRVIQQNDELIWDIVKPPCEPFTLNTPPVALNGTLSFAPGIQAPYREGSVASIQCFPEHTHNGGTSTLLLNHHTQTLEWIPPKLKCHRNLCHEPPAPPLNGMKYGNGRKIADSIEYLCPSDYELIGKWKNGLIKPMPNPYSIRCLLRGEWNFEIPDTFECQPFHCPVLEHLPHTHLQYSRNEGGIATYECFNKSLPIITRTCQADRRWSGQTPTCLPVTVSSNLWIILPVILFVCFMFFVIARVKQRIFKPISRS